MAIVGVPMVIRIGWHRMAIGGLPIVTIGWLSDDYRMAIGGLPMVTIGWLSDDYRMAIGGGTMSVRC